MMCGIPLNGIRLSKQKGPDDGAGCRRVSGHDETVTAIVALAAEDGQSTSPEEGLSLQDLDHAQAGRLHQVRTGYTTVDGPAVDGAHLLSGDKPGVRLTHPASSSSLLGGVAGY